MADKEDSKQLSYVERCTIPREYILEDVYDEIDIIDKRGNRKKVYKHVMVLINLVIVVIMIMLT